MNKEDEQSRHSPEMQLLGEDFFVKVCQNHGLAPDNARLLDEILIEWQTVLGKPEMKQAIFMEKAGLHPFLGNFARAMLEISMTYLERSQRRN